VALIMSSSLSPPLLRLWLPFGLFQTANGD
jgi:hypothetical protein